MDTEKNYYTEEEVKSLVKDWDSFLDFMYGQGCPLVDGKCCYFISDVERYLYNERRRLSRKQGS